MITWNSEFSLQSMSPRVIIKFRVIVFMYRRKTITRDSPENEFREFRVIAMALNFNKYFSMCRLLVGLPLLYSGSKPV